MRDRLIELLKEIAHKVNDDDCRDCESDCVQCAYKSIADYLLENGVIVPKYDLGQEVYCVKDEHTVEKGEVLTIYFDGTFKNIPKYEVEYNGNVFCEDDVFLTEEKAKQKAQKYKGGVQE